MGNNQKAIKYLELTEQHLKECHDACVDHAAETYSVVLKCIEEGGVTSETLKLIDEFERQFPNVKGKIEYLKNRPPGAKLDPITGVWVKS
jgi:hypothetical protein